MLCGLNELKKLKLVLHKIFPNFKCLCIALKGFKIKIKVTIKEIRQYIFACCEITLACCGINNKTRFYGATKIHPIKLIAGNFCIKY